MTREVRILLLGDGIFVLMKEQVGKSTLITSLIEGTFVDKIQHVIPEVTMTPGSFI